MTLINQQSASSPGALCSRITSLQQTCKEGTVIIFMSIRYQMSYKRVFCPALKYNELYSLYNQFQILFTH